MQGKNIIKNFIYNASYQLMMIILPIITTPYVARVLGAEKIGIYSYTEAIVAYFVLFGTLGFSLYGRREIAYKQTDSKDYSRLFWEIFIFRSATMLVATGVFCYLFIFRSGPYSLFYKILLIEILGNILDISWFFQGLEDFKKTVIRSVAVKLVAVICIFIFVKTPSHLSRYFLIYGISTLLGNLALWFYLPRFLTSVKVKIKDIFKHFLPTLALFLPQIATQVYTVLDKVMLGSMISDKSEVGYYEQSQRIIKIILTLVTSLGIVLMPRIANLFANGDKDKINHYIKTSLNVIFVLSFPIIFGLIAVSDVFVPLFFGAGYERVSLLIKIICPIVLFIGMSNVVGTQYLLPTKRQKEFSISVWVGAIINAIFNFIFITRWGAVGAALGTILAELSVIVVQVYFIRKEFTFADIIKSAAKYLIGSLIMYAVLLLMGTILHQRVSNIINIFITITIGVIVYTIYLFVVKDSFLLNIIRKVSGFLKHRSSPK